MYQPLADELGRICQFHGLFHSNGQHFFGHIHAGYPNPLLCQQYTDGTGSAGKVHRRPGPQALPLQNRIVKRHGSFIVHIIGQAVIAGRQSFIDSQLYTPLYNKPSRPVGAGMHAFTISA